MGKEEIGMEPQMRLAQWRENMNATKERLRERFRVTCVPQRFLRQSQRLQPAGVGWRATATTGLVVARVFHGNIVLARVARSMAKNEWQKRIGKFGEYLPSFRTMAAAMTAGYVAFADPAQAEALAILPASYYPSPASYDGNEVSVTLKRQKSGGQAMILGSDSPTTVIEEEYSLFRDDSAFLKMMQAVAVPLIGNVCHVFMHGLNSTEVYGAEKIQQAVLKRQQGQPLITVSNHAAAVDDPFVISSLLPPHNLLSASSLRWTLCASDKCFSSPVTSAFFRSVKVLPLTKGDGVLQAGMDVALTKLNRGEWVHIFPEGSRSRDGNLQLFKRGVGRLVLDADNLPLVVPFIHTGMNDVMPVGKKMFSTGNKITVLVGDPIYVADLVKKHLEEGLSKAVLYDAITLRIEGTMWRMKKKLDELVTSSDIRSSMDIHQKLTMTEKVQGIWQYSDWEAQGFLVDTSGRGMRTQNEGVQLDTSVFSSSVEDIYGNQVDNQQYFGNIRDLRFSDIYSGALNRLPPRMDPTMFMGFAARGLVTSRANLDSSLENLWGRYWRRASALGGSALCVQ